jgi:hypothetical protein
MSTVLTLSVYRSWPPNRLPWSRKAPTLTTFSSRAAGRFIATML